MQFDLLSAIEATASAATIVATLVFAFATTKRRRIQFATGFAAWFAFVVFIGATHALDPERGAGVPALGAAVLLPVAAMGFALFMVPSVRAAILAMPIPILAAANVTRVFGVSFVLLYAAGRLPAPFAPSAGWGDMFVGFTALPVAWFAANYGGRARRLVLAWNSIGIADLVAALAFGATSSPGPVQIFVGPPNSSLMTTLPWVLIPCFLVPSYLFIHFAILYRLSRSGALEGRGSDPEVANPYGPRHVAAHQ